MKRTLTLLCLASLAAAADRVRDEFTPAPLNTQRIEGPIGDRLRVNAEKRLLEGVDVDALLQGYRKRPGQQTWIGEHIGKFIDAGTTAWAYTGDDRLKQKVDAAVKALLATQLPDGYLGTYLEADRFIDYGSAKLEPNEKMPLWDVWAHKYNMIALLNYYDRTGYKPALEACRRMGDLLVRTYGEGPNQHSIVRNDWHVGMANTSVLGPMVQLYRHTGDTKYLDFCRYIVRAWDAPEGPKLLSTLLNKGTVRQIGNAKAYEMLSNFVGVLDLYRATGDEKYLRAMQNGWDDIVTKRLYITGSSAFPELFQDDNVLRADGRLSEGCVTATWMQINLELLRLTGDPKYADQIERTVYNALLGAQHPTRGTICYFTPLNGTKQYGTVSQGIPGVSCCTSSVPRALVLIPAAAWGALRNGIAINLYVPGTVRIGDVTVVSKTRYPVNGEVELELKTTKPARFPLSLRVPAWCKSFVATAGGKEWTGTPGTYLEIDRVWNNGDRVSIQMDMTTRLVPGAPTYPGYFAIERGPQVLAADERLNEEEVVWIAGISDANLRESTKPLPSYWTGSQSYTVRGYVGNSKLGKKPITLTLVPFSDAGQAWGEYRVWLQGPEM
ncbi:MAG: glycoside hydrolase family 127 protein [Acidobacteriota bacterium]